MTTYTTDTSDLSDNTEYHSGMDASGEDDGGSSAPDAYRYADLGADPAATVSQAAHAFGLRISSGQRAVAHNAAVGGAPDSYHLTGQAYDLTGQADQMAGFTRYMNAAYGPNIRELFHDPVGGWKSGQWAGPIGGHRNHVHVAWDEPPDYAAGADNDPNGSRENGETIDELNQGAAGIPADNGIGLPPEQSQAAPPQRQSAVPVAQRRPMSGGQPRAGAGRTGATPSPETTAGNPQEDALTDAYIQAGYAPDVARQQARAGRAVFNLWNIEAQFNKAKTAGDFAGMQRWAQILREGGWEVGGDKTDPFDLITRFNRAKEQGDFDEANHVGGLLSQYWGIPVLPGDGGWPYIDNGKLNQMRLASKDAVMVPRVIPGEQHWVYVKPPAGVSRPTDQGTEQFVASQIARAQQERAAREFQAQDTRNAPARFLESGWRDLKGGIFAAEAGLGRLAEDEIAKFQRPSGAEGLAAQPENIGTYFRRRGEQKGEEIQQLQAVEGQDTASQIGAGLSNAAQATAAGAIGGPAGVATLDALKQYGGGATPSDAVKSGLESYLGMELGGKLAEEFAARLANPFRKALGETIGPETAGQVGDRLGRSAGYAVGPQAVQTTSSALTTGKAEVPDSPKKVAIDLLQALGFGLLGGKPKAEDAAKIRAIADSPEVHPDVARVLRDVAGGNLDQSSIQSQQSVRADARADATQPQTRPQTERVVSSDAQAQVSEEAPRSLIAQASAGATDDPLAQRTAEINADLDTVDPYSERAGRLLATKQGLQRQRGRAGSEARANEGAEIAGPGSSDSNQAGTAGEKADVLRTEALDPDSMLGRARALQVDRLNQRASEISDRLRYLQEVGRAGPDDPQVEELEHERLRLAWEGEDAHQILNHFEEHPEELKDASPEFLEATFGVKPGQVDPAPYERKWDALEQEFEDLYKAGKISDEVYRMTKNPQASGQTERDVGDWRPCAGASHECKTLKDWLADYPELLEEARVAFRRHPEWQGIDPDNALVKYVPGPDVDLARGIDSPYRGHHPHALSLAGPSGQRMTVTGETRGSKKHPYHRYVTWLHKRISDTIKLHSEAQESLQNTQ